MDDFLKMDIFFFIASAATIIFLILLVVALIYLVRILRNIDYISGKAKEGADLVGDDLKFLRKSIKTLVGIFNPKKKKKKKLKDKEK